MKNYDVVIVGGGAAGFFSAFAAAETYPGARLIILEKSNKVLGKVKVSGGGRCNVTHSCFENYNLIKFYPRGNKSLKNPFKKFGVKDTIQWFLDRGVQLKTEDDGRMFPVTNRSQTIIDCFLKELDRLNIELAISESVTKIEVENGAFRICSSNHDYLSEALIIATGGNPKSDGYKWFSESGHSIVSPVPSLFTFNTPDSDLKDLAGISVPNANIRITGTKLAYDGPLLITHWGFSGPAVLKLSAWGARDLHETGYNFTIQIKWDTDISEEFVQLKINEVKRDQGKKKISGHSAFGLPSRLWQRLLSKSGITEDLRWIDLSKKQMNLLMENLVRATFQVSGKTTFKEEFVTCGGVDLQEINLDKMESKKIPRLFFAGEVLNIDGITGGFNFQSAWTTGYIAGKNAAASLVK